jgi:transposase
LPSNHREPSLPRSKAPCRASRRHRHAQDLAVRLPHGGPEPVPQAGCLAHARRKFHELWANHQSAVGEQALEFLRKLYDLERDAKEMSADEGRRFCKEQAEPIANRFKDRLEAQRSRVPDGSATARAIDYSRGRWIALTRYLDDGNLPCDNNWVENKIRLIAIGRSNWLFAGSLRAGKRPAAIMSLVHAAKMNGTIRTCT